MVLPSWAVQPSPLRRTGRTSGVRPTQSVSSARNSSSRLAVGRPGRVQLRYLDLEHRVVMVEQLGLADLDEHPDRDARMLAGVGDAGGEALLEVREGGGCLPGLAGDLQGNPVGDAHAGTSFLGSLAGER